MGLGGQHHAPATLPPVKTRYSLYRRLGGPQGRSGLVRKISPPTGIRSPDRPARGESLYRLSYPDHAMVKEWLDFGYYGYYGLVRLQPCSVCVICLHALKILATDTLISLVKRN